MPGGVHALSPKAASARWWAWHLVDQVWSEGVYANIVWPRFLRESGLPEGDKRFATELAYGTLRAWGQHVAIIEDASGRKQAEIEPAVLALLALGSHQLLQMRVATHAAVHATVALTDSTGLRRARGFVNAVLRRVSEHPLDGWLERLSVDIADPDERLGLRYAHPSWVVGALRQALVREGREHELEEALRANNEPAGVTLALLPGLASTEPGDQATPYSPLGVRRSGDPGHDERVRGSLARVQDEGSQLAALVAAAGLHEGDEALDACAGPGGKAAVLGAYAARVGAHLTAVDCSAHRAELVRHALSAIDSSAWEVVTADTVDFLADQPTRTFQRVLLDAPCSGLGALRRRPEARWRKKPEDIAELTVLQRSLLRSCLNHLDDGGVLVYVTCSPVPEETTEVVEWVMRRDSTVRALGTGAIMDSVASARVPEARIGSAVQLWPHRHNTDAMFIQALTRSAPD